MPGGTVVVVDDGAVGLLGVLSAKQMGAERIIAMSRHEARQKLAREFGATDIVAPVKPLKKKVVRKKGFEPFYPRLINSLMACDFWR